MFVPNKDGRILISWVPPKNLQNQVILKMELNIQVMNILELLVVIVTILSGTVDGKGSNGALHGLTKFLWKMHHLIISF